MLIILRLKIGKFVEQAAFILDGLMKKALQRASTREALENAHVQAKIVASNPRPPSSITNGQTNGQTAVKPFGSSLSLAGSTSGTRETFTQAESQFFVAVPEPSRGGLASPGRIIPSSIANGIAAPKIASNSKPKNAIASSSSGLFANIKSTSTIPNAAPSSSNGHKKIVPSSASGSLAKKVEPTSKVKEQSSNVKKPLDKKQQSVVKKSVEKKSASVVIDLTLDDSDSD